MKIISINVGTPRTIHWKGLDVTTGIFKDPVEGPVMLRRLNIDGDRQADLENHGGRSKAIYAYPAEHYNFWRKELTGTDLPWGAFGENFTVEGLREEEACIGDHFSFGQATLMVTQPRIPCYKLALRLGRDDIVRRFLESNRSGVYFSVLGEGFVATGDPVVHIKQHQDCISVREINRAFADGTRNIPLVRRILRHEVLPSGLREHFLAQLASVESPE
jgi:MOSC domain-containing protein YiiM